MDMAGEDTAILESSTCEDVGVKPSSGQLYIKYYDSASVNGKDRKLTFSAFGATGEPEGGLLPWVSVPESRLSGGFRHVLVLPTGGQPVSLARVQTGHSQCVAKEKQEPMTEVV